MPRKTAPLDQRIFISRLRDFPGGLTVAALAEKMAASEPDVKETLKQLESLEKVEHVGDKWRAIDTPRTHRMRWNVVAKKSE